MRSLEIEKEMYRRAVELINKRYPVGWGGAGVVHTANGNYFTSVGIDTANSSAILCIETGAMLEAHKYNEKVTHCSVSFVMMRIFPIRSYRPVGYARNA